MQRRIWFMLVLGSLTLNSQTSQVLTPPSYPNFYVPFPTLEMLHASTWTNLIDNGLNPPNPPLTRSVAGEDWADIEKSRGTFVFDDSMGDKNNMNFSGTPCAASGWVPAAECKNQNSQIGGERQGNLIYTFHAVPGWASSGGTGWPISYASINCSNECAVTLTINAGNFVLHAESNIKDTVQVNAIDQNTKEINTTSATLTSVSGSGASTMISFTEPLRYYSGSTLITRTSYQGPASGLVTYTPNYVPSDIYQGGEICNYPSNGNSTTTSNGDCYFKEFVVRLMEQNCNLPAGSGIPGSPVPNGTCKVHYFEGWNEFNVDLFWQNNYTELARMMVDADVIIHQFCSDCYFIAGSVSAGGDGYHQYAEPNGVDSSGVYVEALGQLLHDWYFQASDSSRIPAAYLNIKPDAISFHAYPSHDNVCVPPMPESNVAFDVTAPTCISNPHMQSNQNVPGCTAVNPPLQYLSGASWAEPPHVGCRDSIITAINVLANPATGLINAVNGHGQVPVNWFSTSTPVWNTESGWGSNEEIDFGTEVANSLTDPSDNSLTNFFAQSYFARLSILTAASLDAFNHWYQVDDSTYGTMLDYAGNGWTPNTVYIAGSQIWDGSHVQQATTTGMSGPSAPTWGTVHGAMVTDGGVIWENVLPKAGTTFQSPFINPVAKTMNVVYGWLKGVTFNGVPPSARWSPNHTYALNTTIYDGTFIQRVSKAGTSVSSSPPWNGGTYGTTNDGSVVWTNMGTAKCNDTSLFDSSGTLQAGVWSCPVAEPGGHVGEIVWYRPFDSSYVYTTPPGTTCLWDIDGNEKPRLGGQTALIYNRPVLFDNRTDNVCTGH